MKDIAIFGAGGFGREVACLIELINKGKPTWNIIGFFDDNVALRGTKNEYGTILGGIEQLNEYIHNENIWYPNLFAPSTLFLDKNNIKFGHGNIVCSQCIFSCNINIGNFNIFNGLITVGHDATIGSYNSFMPAVRISGEVKIGEVNFFGCSSFVLQQVKIGDNTTIGVNSAVLRKTKDGCTYIGNPAVKVNF